MITELSLNALARPMKKSIFYKFKSGKWGKIKTKIKKKKKRKEFRCKDSFVVQLTLNKAAICSYPSMIKVKHFFKIFLKNSMVGQTPFQGVNHMQFLKGAKYILQKLLVDNSTSPFLLCTFFLL